MAGRLPTKLRWAFNTESSEDTEKNEEKSRFLAALGMTTLVRGREKRRT